MSFYYVLLKKLFTYYIFSVEIYVGSSGIFFSPNEHFFLHLWLTYLEWE